MGRRAPPIRGGPSRTISCLHRSVQACADLIVSEVSNKVGKHKSIYVRAEDLELWQRAEAYARERRMTASGLVMMAIERYLDAEDSETGKDDASR
jgi:hypothetical protein